MRQLRLKHHEAAMTKARLAGGEVELPHPAEAVVIEVGERSAIGEEALAPMAQRRGIMQAQYFEIGQPKPAALDDRRNVRQCRDIAARKDVPSDPGAGEARPAHPADRMEQRDASRIEKPRDCGEEFRILRLADMLEHADRDDAVELAL